MSPVELFDCLFRHDEDALATLHRWAATASGAEILRVAAAARVSLRAQYGPLRGDATAVAALCSLHRNGYVREEALKELAQARSPLVVPFLLLRCDDIVPKIRMRAEELVSGPFMVPALAPAFARSLRIVDALAGRERGGGSPLVERIREFLAGQPEALDEAAKDADALVRLRARELRLRAGDARSVLAQALADRSIQVQLWAARVVASKRVAEVDKAALLPLLDASRLVGARLLALRVRSQLGAAVEHALLDPRAAVRHAARAELRARHPERPFGDARARALEVLSRASNEPLSEASARATQDEVVGALGSRAPVVASARATQDEVVGALGSRARVVAIARATQEEVVGALGALADVGLRADAEVARRFAGDHRARVRHEAERTARVLEA